MSSKIKKIKNLILCLSGLVISTASFGVYADSLMNVYQQALANDSTFKKAEADWLAAQQNLPIARAALLPNLSLQAGLYGNEQDYTSAASFTKNGLYASSNVNLNLSQPIFNWQLWANLASVEASVRAATANYYYAQQDLIARTVTAYLNVLQANDVLHYTRANKAAFAEEYDTAKQKYDVGLVPITDVYDAQSKYDQSKAQEIANINSLENSLESLREITGHYYQYLDGLTEKGIPLITPTPNNIDSWSATAARQNFQLQAQHFNTEAAKENIQVQAAGNLPTLGIQGTASDQRQYDRTLTFSSPPETTTLVQDLATVGLVANLNILSGGSVVASTQQARFQYTSACAQEETTYRQIVSSTRKAFLGVNSNSAQVKADELSIKSASSALQSAKAGYQVGTRTLLDVLDDTTTLYQSQQSHAIDQYAYMNNFVALKESAGTLSPADVATLSRWLTQPIDLEAAKQISSSSETKEPRQPTTATPPSAAAAN